MKKTKIIQNPHDRFFRQAMSHPSVAREFFEAHLPEKIKSLVDLKSLELQKESYIDEELKVLITDVLFAVNFNDQPGYLYILVEHQSKVDHQMPFRLLKYMLAIVEQHLKDEGVSPASKAALPLIYPLVFYTGAKAYTGTTDLFELFGENQGLAREIWLKPFHLVKINEVSDEDLRQRLYSGLMELCFKHIYARDILPSLKKNMLDLFRQLLELEEESYLQSALNYLMRTAQINEPEVFVETLQANLPNPAGEKLMTTVAHYFEQKGLEVGVMLGRQEGRQEGHREGRKEGRQEGRQEGERLVLERLLRRKFGSISESYLQQIKVAAADELLTLSDRILEANTLEEVFK